jgi:hypothetical protein
MKRGNAQMAFIDLIDQQRAAEYVKAQLSQGTTLSRLVVRSADLSGGHFRVAMPESKNQGADFDLRWDTRLGGDEEATFARLIKSYIRHDRCGVILQDTGTSVNYPYFAKLQYKRLAKTFDEEVYWSVAETKLADLSDDEMGTVINYASFWPFSAFFYIDGISATKGELLHDADLQSIVKQLVGVAVGAFDDRSYLVWWRDDLLPFPLVD